MLEDTLIKDLKPRHNIRLKDDKSFLMLRIDDEPFPRLKLVRAHDPRSGKGAGRSRFFGPFASSRAVRRTLSDLHRVIPLRDCPDPIFRNRSRPCIKHQIGLCSAPCVGRHRGGRLRGARRARRPGARGRHARARGGARGPHARGLGRARLRARRALARSARGPAPHGRAAGGAAARPARARRPGPGALRRPRGRAPPGLPRRTPRARAARTPSTPSCPTTSCSGTRS